MPVPQLHVAPADAVADGLEQIRRELGIEPFPAEALAEADAASRAGPTQAPTADLRDVPFVTVDPPGATDLDQAVHIQRSGPGHLVRYAIADVAGFVAPGGALDAAVRPRGVTIYLPDRRDPLHPPVLGDGAASLLPGVDRSAVVWEIALDADGEPTRVDVRRATIRSRAQLAYGDVQHALDGGTADDLLVGLRDVGQARQALERARGGVSLPLADQQVTRDGDRWRLDYRTPLPVEGWNAQLSLLAGLGAARLMLDAGVGILRTLPPPPDETLRRLRRHARALGVPWPEGAAYSDVIAHLDVTRSTHVAFVTQAARLFRGSGYLAFTDGPPAPEAAGHAAVAAPYAHVTAPLRRLVDRFANEVVLAVAAGTPPPPWAVDALDGLPSLMGAARQREARADALATDLVEAHLLAGRVGEVLEGVVVDRNGEGSLVQLVEPAVVARIPADLGLGDEVRLRVVGADLSARRVDLEVA